MVTKTTRQAAAVHLLHVMADRAANITFLPFWTENLTSLFTPVEAWFQVKNIYKEWDRFDFAITILSKEVIQLCFATMVHPNTDEPYTKLKEDLLQQHTHTMFQRIKLLLPSVAWATGAPPSSWQK
jgi:hypothetical protein